MTTLPRPSLVMALALVTALQAGPAAAQGPGCQGHAATIVGTAGTDRIAGTNGADVIAGLGGDDVLRGLGGHDLLCGGGGRDLVRGGKGDDAMDGGGGDDRLLGGKGFDLVTFESAPRGVRVDLAASRAFGYGRDQVDSVWWVIGSPFGDRLSGANAMEVLIPLGGRDRVRGRGGWDLIDGGPGRDRLSGGRGEDVLLGQGGNDDLDGGRGSDTASFAGAGRRVRVDLAADRSTGEGRDSLESLEDVEGSPYADWIAGGRGPNTIVGGEGGDAVRGRGGNDRVLGLEGDDSVRLGAGNDTGRGGRDDDSIDGGPGIDRTYGGAGHDVCRNGEVLGCDEYDPPGPLGAAPDRSGRGPLSAMSAGGRGRAVHGVDDAPRRPVVVVDRRARLGRGVDGVAHEVVDRVVSDLVTRVGRRGGADRRDGPGEHRERDQ